ncbi:hypothetical protein V1502_11075 [Bacillus sp. SCS-153A]|uniref:hypothetical protein n=1 Tax=Rossellomorea sedimentorum TaxID=3115294 RepID=UPI003905D287
MVKKEKAIEILVWSIALPGFGQLLNGKYIKGVVFVFLKIIINIYSNFNEVIYFSFNGEFLKAEQVADKQWLMFYPCIYFFAMWDAYKDAGGGKEPYSYLPFVFSAYIVTVGIMYSDKASFFGIGGILWFPMICVVPGIVLGFALKFLLNRDRR